MNISIGKLYLNNKNIYVNADNNQLLTSNINLNHQKSSLYPNGQLYYVNKDTKQISVVNSNQINRVDNSNHEIYCRKVNINYEGNTYSMYTRAIFILTENDYQNFDNQINKWMQLAKLIK